MKLKTATYEIPLGDFAKHCLEPKLGYSSGNGVGMFDPYAFYFQASSPFSNAGKANRVTLEELGIYLDESLSKINSTEERLEFLIDSTAWYHEVRHYHDCLCTPMGFNQWKREWQFNYLMLKTIHEIRESGLVLDRSLLSYQSSMGSEAPKLIIRLLDIYLNSVMRRACDNGDLPELLVEQNARDFDIVNVRLVSPDRSGSFGEIPCYPAGVKVGDQTLAKLLPMGFRAMVENTATILQSMMIRAHDAELTSLYLQRLKQARPEYVVFRIFATTQVKKQGFDWRSNDGGAQLEESIYRWLMTALLSDQADSAMTHPGKILLDIYDENPAKRFPEFEGNPTAITSAITKCRNLAQSQIQEFDRSTEQSFLSVLDWFAWRQLEAAMNTYLKPADDGLKSDMRGKVTPDVLGWYVLFGSALPQPPISFQPPDNLGLSESWQNTLQMDPRDFFHSLHIWIMLRSIVEQIAISSDIHCPVLKGPHQKFFEIKHTHPHEACEMALNHSNHQPRCGCVELGQSLLGHVDCIFKKNLINWGLARP